MYSIPDPYRALVKEGSSCAVRRVAAAPRANEDDDVIVRIAWAGICRTDLYAAEGRLATASPIVLGHEASGIIVDGASRVGEHVTILPRVRCKACLACVRGAGPLQCDLPQRVGIDRDGVFAEYVRLPRASVLAVPNDLSLRLAAYVEPVAAALAVLSVIESGDLGPSDRGLIYGTNRIAELTRRVLAASGVDRVTVLSTSDADDSPRGNYDFAIETVASATTMGALLKSVRRGGRIVLKSRPFEPVPFDVGMAVEKEITLHSVRYAPFATAIEWLATRKIVVDDLLGDEYSLDRFEDAFVAARKEANKPFFKLAGG